jgi:hypothetical protein
MSFVDARRVEGKKRSNPAANPGARDVPVHASVDEARAGEPER